MRLSLPRHLSGLGPRLAALPFYTWPVLGLICLGIGYGLLYVLPAPVIAYSYAAPSTCAPSLVLFPSTTTSSTHTLQLRPSSVLTIFHWPVLATAVCTTITQPISDSTLSTSLFVGQPWFMAKRYTVTIPPLPTIDPQPLTQPIPLTKPLTLTLSTADVTHTYHLQANNKSQQCLNQDLQIACSLESLQLSQGQDYQVSVTRQLNHHPVDTVIDQKVTTLFPITITSTSFAGSATIYTQPNTIVLYADKPIAVIKAKLVANDQEVAITATAQDQQATIAWAKPLARSTSYTLTVTTLEAPDGSSLAQPYQLTFTTSGGPKVVGINIAKAGVALGATAIITFDQAIDTSQDLSSLISLKPGSAKPSAKTTTISLPLSGIDACVDFTINLAAGLISQYGVSATTTWSYTSRTICHTSQVIGYSVKGRPIMAYYYGSGGTTILYTAAIHGSEASSKYLMDAWMAELEANARNLPAGRQFVVVPIVNPDGFASGSRYNANGVDLNRNFDVSDWQSNITTTSNQPLSEGGGKSPMDQPETQAIANLTSRLRPKTTMSFHSIGGLVIANQAANSNALAQTYSKLSGYWNSTGQSDTTFDYSISGTYDDWIAEKLGLASVLVELGSHTNPQISRNLSGLWYIARN